MAAAVPKEELIAIIRAINIAGEALSLGDTSQDSDARRALLLEAKKLVASLEDPNAEVWPRAFQVNVGVSVYYQCLAQFCIISPIL